MKYFYLFFIPAMFASGLVIGQNQTLEVTKKKGSLEVNQIGRDNSVIVYDQNRKQPDSKAEHLEITDAAGNRVIVKDAKAMDSLFATGHYSVFIKQSGMLNQATVSQYGSRNKVSISQSTEKPK